MSYYQSNSIMTQIMNLDKWNVIRMMIVNSSRFSDVRKQIQDVFGEMLDVPAKSIEVAIHRYYHSLPKDEIKRVGPQTPAFSRVMKRYDGIPKEDVEDDPLNGLWHLADLQLNRVDFAMEFEERMDMPMISTDKNVELLMKIYLTINRVKRKMERDEARYKIINEPKGRTLAVIELVKERLQLRFGGLTQVLTDPIARSRVISTVDKLKEPQRSRFRKIFRLNIEDNHEHVQ